MDSQFPDTRNIVNPFIIEPTSKHTHSFIILHPTGITGEGFGKKMKDEYLCSDGEGLIQKFPCARFIFPTTPPRQPVISNPESCEEFDAIDPNYGPAQRLMARRIMSLIDQEALTIGRENVILGSSARAIVLSCFLACRFRIGGFIGLNVLTEHWPSIGQGYNNKDKKTYNLHPDDDKEATVDDEILEMGIREFDRVVTHCRRQLGLDVVDISSINDTSIGTPVFIGYYDSTCRVCERLSDLGYKVTSKSYIQRERDWTPEQMDDIVEFLQDRVNLCPRNIWIMIYMLRIIRSMGMWWLHFMAYNYH
ncbi:acyl-protein thioesterase [Hypomontagnella monticulosa]|nr:acyl-protein thioesterase [Hypomontagnella monticulosa]